MAKKKKPKKNQEPNSKLILPGAGAGGAKSQLMVPGGTVGATTTPLTSSEAEAPQPILVTEGQIPQPAVEEQAWEDQAPVKITAMVPPPAQEPEEAYAAQHEAAEPVEPVAMEAPAEQEVATEYAEPEAEVAYEQPVEEVAYEQPVEEVYEQPAEEYVEYAQPAAEPEQQAYYDPAQQPALEQPVYEQPAYEQQADAQPVYEQPAPNLAPPLPAAGYQQPAAPQPYGYGQPPLAQGGYQAPGMATATMYPGLQPTRMVPGWALILVGTLVGFLCAMVIFKFTDMGAALRGDLIQEGRAKEAKIYEAKIKALTDTGYDEEEDEEPVTMTDEPDTEKEAEAEKSDEPDVEAELEEEPEVADDAE